MKKAFFLVSLILLSTFNISCRKKPAEISLSCQRLTSCYTNYQNLVKDQNVKNLVEAAQRDGDDARCTAATAELSKSINQECPF